MTDGATRPAPIRDKAEMYRLLNAGRLGPTLAAAETVADARRLTAGGGSFAVRMKQAGGLTRFGLSAADALALVETLPAGGWNLSATLSDPDRVCYGHLLDGPGGWNLHYSTDPKPCRLKELQDGCRQRTLAGLAARLYLQAIVDPLGWEVLTELVDLYPAHVIEFTVMSSRLAAYGPSNLIVWEVRCDGGAYEATSGWGRPG